MMLHIRIDQAEFNKDRRFACGLGPELPEGDKWVYESESMADRADCPGCNPAGPRQIGVRASSMNGNAMQRDEDPAAWANWVAYCERNGHP